MRAAEKNGFGPATKRKNHKTRDTRAGGLPRVEGRSGPRKRSRRKKLKCGGKKKKPLWADPLGGIPPAQKKSGSRFLLATEKEGKVRKKSRRTTMHGSHKRDAPITREGRKKRENATAVKRGVEAIDANKPTSPQGRGGEWTPNLACEKVKTKKRGGGGGKNSLARGYPLWIESLTRKPETLL